MPDLSFLTKLIPAMVVVIVLVRLGLVLVRPAWDRPSLFWG